MVAVVERPDLEAWCAATFPLLYETLAALGEVPAGPGGGLYPPEWFENATGRVVGFVPTGRTLVLTGTDGVQSFELPAGPAAVARHRGSFDDLDRTYGALGSYVARNKLGGDGFIREHYLVSPADSDDPNDLRTEVCWPIRPERQGATS